MTLSHARETVPSSSLEGETGHGPQARKGLSVVLIDQQTLTRHCLSRSFQEGLPDLRVVAVANLADLRQHMPRVPLVLLIDRDDMDDIVEALAQGVRGVITTGMELSETGAAIQCVAAGGTFVPASILVRFAQDRQNRPHCGPSEDSKELFESLTPRELEVLALLREGKPNKVVARALGIREGTVKVFVGRILGKLRVSNRTELAVLARVWSAGAEPDGA